MVGVIFYWKETSYCYGVNARDAYNVHSISYQNKINISSPATRKLYIHNLNFYKDSKMELSKKRKEINIFPNVKSIQTFLLDIPQKVIPSFFSCFPYILNQNKSINS